jgi:hypothetical protein
LRQQPTLDLIQRLSNFVLQQGHVSDIGIGNVMLRYPISLHPEMAIIF